VTYTLLDAVKDDLGLNTPYVFSILCGECGQVCIGQTERPFRPWRDDCHTWLAQFHKSAVAYVSAQTITSKSRAPKSFPPVREPPYFFKTARSFCLDCWTLKVKQSSSETSGIFCPTVQHYILYKTWVFRKPLNYTWRNFPGTCVMVKYCVVVSFN